jgi:transposase
MDLRVRVLAAIDAGSSRRQAAARFGVSASSAIRWHELRRRQGDARPRKQGGDRRSRAIEAQAGTVLALLEKKPNATLGEMRAELARQGRAFG